LGTRSSVSLAKKELSAAEAIVVSTAEKIKKRQFAARPGKQCKSCEVRMVCSSAKR
jgi:CRISPR/Cas system-associated exonuclease Cas4 (RecB family)